MITVERLHRTYGSLQAVNNVSFAIASGEVIGLLGPNGAGKTTIMKMLCGFLEPSSGKIHIHQTDVAEHTKQAQSLVGYLPENLPVYPDMTVMGYLEYAAGLRGIPVEQQAKEIVRVIAETELQSKATSQIAHLSRGLKQRVGVAQALLGSPKVLILDEPTNGLDPTQTQHMRDLIRKLAKSATVILSTHILSEVEAVCDRVLIMRSGELVLDSRLDSLQKSAAIHVQTSLPESQLAELLNKISGVTKVAVSTREQITHARIDCQHSEHAQRIAADIAKAIIQAGAELYQLEPEHRDLETLFRELNNEAGVRHAA
jgi:ABC-2 type transport system ATP-binding protein